MKRIFCFILSLIIIFTFASCDLSNNFFDSSQSSSGNSQYSSDSQGSASFYDDSSTYDSSSVSVPEGGSEVVTNLTITSEVVDGYTTESGVITFTKAGDYTLTGSGDNLQIVVTNTDEAVNLYFDSVTITSSLTKPIISITNTANKVTLSLLECSLSSNGDSVIYINTPDKKVDIDLMNSKLYSTKNSVIYAEDVDKLSISSKSGYESFLYDYRELKTEDVDGQGEGCIYSKDDLEIKGAGTLNVNGSYNNGIHSNNDIEIQKLTLNVYAPNNAIKGKDSITIYSGKVKAISTGGDGLKTENSDIDNDKQRGNINIQGGDVYIYSACDGIDSAYDTVIEEVDNTIPTNVNIFTDSYSQYTGSVFSGGSSNGTLYVGVNSRYYSSSYRYVLYFYNSDSDYKWVTTTYYSYSRGIGGPSGGSSYYYLTCDAPSNYANVCVYMFSSSQTENSTTTYLAKSSNKTVNTNMNLLQVTAYNSQSKSLTIGWGTYSNQQGGGFDPGGGGNSNNSEYSTKGIKASNQITINGGSLSISSRDDCLHANNDTLLDTSSYGVGNISINGGNISLRGYDDAMHADSTLTISGGTINVATAYEGLEGNTILIKGGYTTIYATDDGVNAAGGNNPSMTVSGGNLDVTVGSGDVDGIDSNGNYTQTGGFVITRDGANDSSGNMSGLDINGTCTITGGTFICVGPRAELPSSNSQNYVVFGSSGGFGGRIGFGGSTSGKTFTAGTYTISSTDISFTLSTTYTNMWISSNLFNIGSSYTITNGTTSYTWTQSSKSVTVS